MPGDLIEPPGAVSDVAGTAVGRALHGHIAVVGQAGVLHVLLHPVRQGSQRHFVPAQLASPFAPELLVFRRAAAFRAGRGGGRDRIVSALPHAANRRGVLRQIEEPPVGRPVVADAPAGVKVSSPAAVAALVAGNAATPEAMARVERLEGAGLQGELEFSCPVELQPFIDEPGAKNDPLTFPVDRGGRQGIVVVHAFLGSARETDAAIVVSHPAKRRHVALPLPYGIGKTPGVPKPALPRIQETAALLPILPHPLHRRFHERGAGPAQRQFQVALAEVHRPGDRREQGREPVKTVVIENASHYHPESTAGECLLVVDLPSAPRLEPGLIANERDGLCSANSYLQRGRCGEQFLSGGDQAFQKAGRAVRADSSHARDGVASNGRRREWGRDQITHSGLRRILERHDPPREGLFLRADDSAVLGDDLGGDVVVRAIGHWPALDGPGQLSVLRQCAIVPRQFFHRRCRRRRDPLRRCPVRVKRTDRHPNPRSRRQGLLERLAIDRIVEHTARRIGPDMERELLGETLLEPIAFAGAGVQ